MRRLIIAIFIAIVSTMAYGQSSTQEIEQQMAKVKGIVIDSVSGTTIPYATVSVVDVFTKQYILRTVTTTDGEFEVEVPFGSEVCLFLRQLWFFQNLDL